MNLVLEATDQKSWDLGTTSAKIRVIAGILLLKKSVKCLLTYGGAAKEQRITQSFL